MLLTRQKYLTDINVLLKLRWKSEILVLTPRPNQWSLLYNRTSLSHILSHTLRRVGGGGELHEVYIQRININEVRWYALLRIIIYSVVNILCRKCYMRYITAAILNMLNRCINCVALIAELLYRATTRYGSVQRLYNWNSRV